MQIIKQFSGFMNTDDSNENMLLPHHKYAKNLRFRGNGNNLRAESINGTNLIPNSYLPSGTNEEGLPYSIQFMTPHFREDLLFEIGKDFEKVQGK